MGTGGTVYALQIKWEFSGKAPVFHNNNRKRSVLFECGKTQREKGNVRPNLSGRYGKNTMKEIKSLYRDRKSDFRETENVLRKTGIPG